MILAVIKQRLLRKVASCLPCPCASLGSRSRGLLSSDAALTKAAG